MIVMKLTILSYAYGNAANNPGCGDGPRVMKKSQFLANSPLDWQLPLVADDQSTGKDALSTVANLNQELAKKTANLCKEQKQFVALGGDHSMAIGTWSGVSDALAKEGPLGLIWIDAHLDSNTFNTTPSNNIHGMPLAALLGHGDPALTNILNTQPKLNPENVVIIGVRSYEQGEFDLLKSLGVKIVFMEDIINKGIHSVFQDALAIVTRNTAGFGVSFDCDAIDPNDAPGVGCQETNGIRSKEFLDAFPILLAHDKLLGLEIAEFNPHRDIEQKTEKLIADCILLL